MLAVGLPVLSQQSGQVGGVPPKVGPIAPNPAAPPGPGLATPAPQPMPKPDPTKALRKITGQTERLLVSLAPEKDRLWVFNTETGLWNQYRAPEGTTINPILGGAAPGSSMPEVIALDIRGDRIGEIAGYSSKTGAWRLCHFKEPVKGPIPVIAGHGVAVYIVGREIFAYSAAADMWGGIKLKEGPASAPHIFPQSVVVEQGDTIYAFSVQTGTWRTAYVGKP